MFSPNRRQKPRKVGKDEEAAPSVLREEVMNDSPFLINSFFTKRNISSSAFRKGAKMNLQIIGWQVFKEVGRTHQV
jgi:hypothetical protein